MANRTSYLGKTRAINRFRTKFATKGPVTEYDALDSRFRTIDDNGRISETLYDKRGLAVETRSELPDENGEGVWLVSRTVYDKKGRAIYSPRFLPAR